MVYGNWNMWQPVRAEMATKLEQEAGFGGVKHIVFYTYTLSHYFLWRLSAYVDRKAYILCNVFGKLWLAKSRVFISMENMKILITSLYAIAYAIACAIMNNMEILRFDKEVLLSTGYFIKEI